MVQLTTEIHILLLKQEEEEYLVFQVFETGLIVFKFIILMHINRFILELFSDLLQIRS